MVRRHNKEGGNHLDQESSRQKTMEDIDGGLHPAVDEQSLGDIGCCPLDRTAVHPAVQSLSSNVLNELTKRVHTLYLLVWHIWLLPKGYKLYQFYARAKLKAVNQTQKYAGQSRNGLDKSQCLNDIERFRINLYIWPISCPKVCPINEQIYYPFNHEHFLMSPAKRFPYTRKWKV